MSFAESLADRVTPCDTRHWGRRNRWVLGQISREDGEDRPAGGVVVEGIDDGLDLGEFGRGGLGVVVAGGGGVG